MLFCIFLCTCMYMLETGSVECNKFAMSWLPNLKTVLKNNTKIQQLNVLMLLALLTRQTGDNEVRNWAEYKCDKTKFKNITPVWEKHFSNGLCSFIKSISFTRHSNFFWHWKVQKNSQVDVACFHVHLVLVFPNRWVPTVLCTKTSNTNVSGNHQQKSKSHKSENVIHCSLIILKSILTLNPEDLV